MPFDDAVALLSPRYRLVFPDRRGYGRSTPLEQLPRDYHRRAMIDLAHFLDALAIERPILWGHSDGAITAAMYAAEHPARPAALVVEAIHFYRAKSKAFFAKYARTPQALPPGTVERLATDHGERWPTVVRMHSEAWLDFHEVGGDFYEGMLGRIRCPTLVLYGEGDPHTPTSESEALGRRIPGAILARVAGGGHSPHSETATARFCSERVLEFLREQDL